MNYIMSIDQGTTGTTVSIVNYKGQILAKVNEEYRQIFPQPGWVEHDPEDIWKSVKSTISQAIDKAKIQPSEIAAIGITNQRETVVMWDKKTGQPIYNAIVWQCRRTQKYCESLRAKKRVIQKKTGLVIDPYFSASKIHWLLKNVPLAKVRAKKSEVLVGTIDSFLIWRLTAGKSHRTDVSNASRTMLMNIHTGKWDAELLKIFGVPSAILPEICDSVGEFGQTLGLDFLPNGIPITGVAGDQQAALFGQMGMEKGESKCTFGTGSFIVLNTGHQPIFSKHNLLTTVAWRLPGQKMVYAMEGGAFICGAAVQWLRDGLGIIQSSSEMESLANQVSDTGGVQFVPALTGLGAPYWWPESRGVITGLTRGTTKSHIARATLEAMALQNAEILLAMEKDLKKKIKNLRVDGGASVNALLMQMQADYAGTPVIRPMQIETTSMGAAYLAGLGAGIWKNVSEIRQIWKADQTFKPTGSQKNRRLRIEKWRKAILKTKE